VYAGGSGGTLALVDGVRRGGGNMRRRVLLGWASAGAADCCWCGWRPVR